MPVIDNVLQNVGNELAEQEETLWVLYYRQGSNPHSMSKQFYHSGTLPEVISRCKSHCEVMGYRFTNVRPAISDLAQDEAKHIS